MQRVCVLGAGTMGSGIAAHLANLGFQVDLLDLTLDSARAALDRAKAVKPPHFYGPEALARVRIGGISDDLSRVSEADWVCEAIVEKLDLKRELYTRLIPHLRPDAMVSTNTSGLELRLLSQGLPEDFQRRFLGTHFFNPPRYLKLLELIPTDTTDPAEIERATKFLEEQMARRVVVAKDTPGFIANRFGMWAMLHAVHTTEQLGLTIEEVDSICGPFLGRPRSGAFRLNDLVGVDIMLDIARNLYDRCPDDPLRESLSTPRSLAFLMEKGWIGQKAGQGYYRKEGKELLALDLSTHAYRNALEVSLPSVQNNARKPIGERIGLALEAKDEAGEFLRHHLIPVLKYADYLKEEVSHCVQDFDRVMMWGFGWEMGPFAMIDAIGADKLGMSVPKYYVSGTQRDWSGQYTPVRNEPEYRSIHDFPVVEERTGHTIRDLGDGVMALGLSSKMGVLSPEMIQPMMDWVANHDGPFVLCGETKAFSAGFNLAYFIQCLDDGKLQQLDGDLALLQALTILLSSKRAVAAVHGFCLGGGMELAMACPMVCALAESQMGLPEAKVGVIPAAAGTSRMRLRAQTSAKELTESAMVLTQGMVANGAAEALRLRYLRPTDQIVHHPDGLIHAAKRASLEVEAQPMPQWTHPEGPLTGMIDLAQKQLVEKGTLTKHDEVIGDKIKAVFSKSHDFEEALQKEREGILSLLGNALSVARIKHMLETNKPLRN